MKLSPSREWCHRYPILGDVQILDHVSLRVLGDGDNAIRTQAAFQGSVQAVRSIRFHVMLRIVQEADVVNGHDELSRISCGATVARTVKDVDFTQESVTRDSRPEPQKAHPPFRQTLEAHRKVLCRRRLELLEAWIEDVVKEGIENILVPLVDSGERIDQAGGIETHPGSFAYRQAGINPDSHTIAALLSHAFGL
jgi:hypothetical protein